MSKRLKAEWRNLAVATFFEEMSGSTEAPLTVDIDPGLECVKLTIQPEGERPVQLLMHPYLALRVAMELGANCERLRLALAKEDEK